MKSTCPGSLHHIELYVSNLDRSREFWGWFLGELGYAPGDSWEGGCSFVGSGTYIVIVQTAERFLDPPYHRCRTGLNHLAFNAASRAQVDGIAAALAERGLSALYEDQYPHAGGPGHYALFFEDPDRIKVELVAPQ